MTRTIVASMLVLASSLAATASADAQQALPLYPGAVPNAIDAPDRETVRDPKEAWPFLLNISRPTLTPYLPKHRDAKRAAIIILPGGGYRGVSAVKEGMDVARAFNEMGIAAFVLKYRTPSSEHMQNRALGPLQDAQQAMFVVRSHADEWNIDRERVGLIGFSAGGHLAATAATRFDKPVLPQWQGVNLRPDFLMLIYPVISFDADLGHAGSRQMLLGDAPSVEMVREYSNEWQVTAQTPRSFIVHAADDTSVPVGNSLRFFEALQSHGIPAELMVYPAGGHGFGLNNATTTDRWIDRCQQWLVSQGLLSQEHGR